MICELLRRVACLASAALFELDQQKRGERTRKQSDWAGSGKALRPPHIMASYNWDHQDVILRVVASLQERGYLVG